MTALTSKETKSQGKCTITTILGTMNSNRLKFTSSALGSTSSTASAPTSPQRVAALISVLVLWSTLNSSTMRLLSFFAMTKASSYILSMLGVQRHTNIQCRQ